MSKRARPRDTTPPTDAPDPRASPLGRGVDPGPMPDPYPLSEREPSIAGLRGAGVPGERGGPEGFVARANEDAEPKARRRRYS